MRIESEVKLDYSDVLIKPKRSMGFSRSAVNLTRNYTFLNSQIFWEGVPLIAANMSTTGTFAMTNALAKFRASVCLHKHYPVDELIEFYKTDNAQVRASLTFGIKDSDYDKLVEVTDRLGGPIAVPFITIDAANGYTEYFVNRCAQVRELLPKTIIMAGNVCTPEMVQELLFAGVDIVKIGIGPGSVCTTRVKTGVGYPQFSAVAECAEAAHGLQGHICADGGCTVAGDVVKAFGAGADFVMLGGMLAGTDECEGEWEYNHVTEYADVNYERRVGKKALKFYGMSSEEAMKKYNGGKASYKAAEGKSVTIPFKGPAGAIVEEVLGGLRSACTYVGTESLKDFSKCCTFVKVNRTHNTVYGN
jgi:GMP reductase